jgi:hypothetical protein
VADLQKLGYLDLPDGTRWSNPLSERMQEIAWTLIHGKPSRADLVGAGAIISQYAQLLQMPLKRQNAVAMAMRRQEVSRG